MASNLITDVEGLTVGEAHDPTIASGVTAILFDEPAVAAVDMRGGAPGTRETDLLAPERTVERVDAIVLSGGSAFGLEAAAGVMACLAEAGRGFPVGATTACRSCRPRSSSTSSMAATRPGAATRLIASWATRPPRRPAAGLRFGSVGAGLARTTANLKGGIGSASAPGSARFTVGAIVAVNAFGSATIGDGPHFWAAPFEQEASSAASACPRPFPPEALRRASRAARRRTRRLPSSPPMRN